MGNSKPFAKMTRRYFSLIGLFVVISIFLPSCKNKEPSILKVYVRSAKNILLPNATVRIVGDIDKDTPEYYNEKRSNEQGVAIFKLEDLFNQYGEDEAKVAYFTVYARDTSIYYTTMTARAKAHMTYTKTITLEE